MYAIIRSGGKQYRVREGDRINVDQIDLRVHPDNTNYFKVNWDSSTYPRPSNSCGNGVCDAHELCNTCQFDCGCGGAQVCNAQTGRCHSPAGVCQAPRGAA